MREVARLRLAFDAHNQFEEHQLHSALVERDTSAGIRERMVEEHASEHCTMRRQLLDTEERYLLTSRVLRDELAPAG